MTTEDKLKKINSLTLILKTGLDLEETVRQLTSGEVLKVARLLDEVPHDKIADSYDVLMEAARLAFKIEMENYIDLCGLLLNGEGTRELRALSYKSALQFYTDIVNPRAYVVDASERERDFYISRIDQVLNAKFAQSTKDLNTLEIAFQDGTLEEESKKFDLVELQNLFEIVDSMANRTCKYDEKYLAVMEATRIKMSTHNDKTIDLEPNKAPLT